MQNSWVSVPALVDGQGVDAQTFNPPLFALAERTNYLYNRLQALVGQDPLDSVRVSGVALDTSIAGAPVVGNVVYLDPVTGAFTKAKATMAVLDAFVASDSSMAIGVLIAATGDTGTVLLAGRLPLRDPDNTPWALSALVQDGETFRSGQYYLSSQAGRITAYPSGPRIYVGFFLASKTSPAYGDYAVLTPQLRDTGESHVHRVFKVLDQPAGAQEATGTDPLDTVAVTGFLPEVVEGNAWQPRLVVTGSWLGSGATQYTCWLSNNATKGEARESSAAPSDFGDAYLNWVSSDPVEGSGYTRVWSFEIPVAIGTKGLYCSLENPLAPNPIGGVNWSEVYSVVADTPDRRTWIFTAPDQTVGWLANLQRQVFAGTQGAPAGFSLILMGGPFNPADGRQSETITVACREIHEFSLVPVSEHDTLTIDDAVFEYTADGTVSTGNIPVVLTGSMLSTYENLLAAILDCVKQPAIPVLDPDELSMALGTIQLATVYYTIGGIRTNVNATSSGHGNIGSGASLLVFDQNNRNLVTNYGSMYWGALEYWQFCSLKNGLQVMPIPFSGSGVAKTSDYVEIGDYWVSQVSSPAPGAAFRYAVGQDQALSKFYPPIPAHAASLVRNGVELAEVYFNPGDPTYCLGPDALYWYSNLYGKVPWPSDWTAASNPGALQNQQDIRLHFIRSTIGNSGYVTSLQPAAGSPIKIVQCGTNTPGNVGDLAIDLDLKLKSANSGIAGYMVLKGASGSTLTGGPVVEKIVAGPGISLTQNAGAPGGQGIVTISSADSQLFQGDFQDIALLNAKQEMIGMFPYIKLNGWVTGSQNIDTGFTAMFRAPHTLSNQRPYRVIVYATVFGLDDIPYTPNPSVLRAGLSFQYSILPDVYSLGDYLNTGALNLQDNLMAPAAQSVEIPFGCIGITSGVIYKGFDPILVHNNDQEGIDIPNQRVRALGSPFPNPDDFPAWPNPENTLGVRPGSLVAVKFNRAGVYTGAEYQGALGFINLHWVLVTI